MNRRIIEAARFFDGRKLRAGVHRLEIADGVFTSIRPGAAADADERYDFMMPPLTESHCHLFLDGDELDNLKRREYLALSPEDMFGVGKANLEKYASRGIFTVRDAGDNFGVNHRLREFAAAKGIRVISAGRGVRKAGRYGSFMAREIASDKEIPAVVADIAAGSDTLKIVLTGIIDFARGAVKGEPQFSAAELTLLIKHAREHGLKTFVHCSGADGLRLAVAAGVDSIEHGFFMNRAILEQMAEKRIAWVPTFIPVEFQARHGGWDPDAVAGLRRILDNHASMLVLAADLGVPVMAGSDAGSPGVKHGSGILEELKLMYAAGLDRDRVLAGATSVPQEHFGLGGGCIAVGRKADFITFDPLDLNYSGTVLS